jgi:hypothetical protein
VNGTVQLPSGGCFSGIHMTDNKVTLQLIWGGVLTFAGLMMFLSIPQKMIEVEKQFTSGLGFLRFSLYVVSALLFCGGAKKIYDVLVILREKKDLPPTDNHHEMKRR